MVIVVQADTLAFLRQENIDITVCGVFMQMALDIVPQSLVPVTERNRLCTEVIIESAS